MKTLFVISTLLLSVFADDDHGKSSVDMKASSFKEEVAKGPHFVMFFAPWCGHCKTLAPTWDDLGKKFNEEAEKQEVVIAKVDCTVETSLCSSQDVTGYPTLKYFKDGPDSGVKYRGQRDLESLVKYIDEQMGRAPEKVEELVQESEDPEVEKGLYTLGEKSFKKHIAKGETFIKFYAPWCGHCQKLAPTWDELAEKVDKEGAIKATVAKIDCTYANTICRENGIEGYPTLAYFKDGVKVETYSGARTLKELFDFVQSMSDVKVAEEKEVTEDAKEAVVKLNGENFKETVASGVTFVKFFAPWCGHCKRLAPTWEQLAAKYEGVQGVTIAKVDCTSEGNKDKELCNQEGVNGFPTLNIYQDGKKVEEYNGKRSLEDLEQFVEKVVNPKKDEL